MTPTSIETMTLSHYTRAEAIEPRSVEQPDRCEFKPRGLWVSVDGPDDWPSWCKEEGFRDIPNSNHFRVTLADDARILHLDGMDDLVRFTTRYGEQAWPGAHSSWIKWGGGRQRVPGHHHRPLLLAGTPRHGRLLVLRLGLRIRLHLGRDSHRRNRPGTHQYTRSPEPMTNDDETFERWIGPVRQVISAGGREIPLLPPRVGETRPFAWAIEAAQVVSMDVDGRPVESVTLKAEDGRGKLIVRFKDGEEVAYDQGQIHSTHDHP